jgi:uncharacterized membrane protein
VNALPWTYGYWALAGGLVAIGVAGVLPIGLPLLLIGLALVGVGLSKPSLRNRSLLGGLLGIALVAVVVTWITMTGSAP